MLTHDKTIDLIGEVLEFQSTLVDHLRERPDSIVTGEELERYQGFVARLAERRRNDPRLGDEAWTWIFSESSGPWTHLQLYGRLAFISYELFHYL